jgi:uncharacterized protein (TIRG00374 family)
VNETTKRLVWHAVRLAVVAALVALVLWRTDLGETAAVAGRLADRWGWALAALGVMMLQSPLGAVRWRMLLAVQGVHLTFLESLRLTYLGWFFNNWMPGSTGGDFVKAYYVARQTHHQAEAVTVVFVDRFIGLVAVCMMGGVAVFASLNDERVRVARLIVAAFLVFVLVGGTVFYNRRLRALLRVDWMLARLPLRRTVEKVDRALLAYRHHKGTVALAIVYSWGAQAVGILAMWWVAVALGSRAVWFHYFVAVPAIWIGWSLVPVPGGFGVAEGLAQGLFGSAVLSGDAAAAPFTDAEAAALALAMMLAYRIVQMLVSLPGAYFYLTRRTGVSASAMVRQIKEG